LSKGEEKSKIDIQLNPGDNYEKTTY